MKTLNRPMFRYGGPIKEGVMNGIREPKRNGGSMGEPQATYGAGNNMNRDASGREKHALFVPPMIMAGLGMAGRALARPFARYISTKVPASMGIKFAGKKGAKKVIKTGKDSKKMVDYNRYEATPLGNYLKNSPEAGLITGAGGKITKGIYNTGKYAVKSPLTVASAAGFGGKKLYDALNAEPDKKDPAGVTEINKLKRSIGMPENLTLGGGQNYEGDPEKELTDAEREQIESDNRMKQMDRYREIMDIKGMSKDAAYKSLIDAGKIIQEGGNLKEQLKSGKLISNITQAASKRFDKVNDTEAALRSLVVKGEIENELNKEDKALKRKQLRTSIALAEKGLAGDNFDEAILKSITGTGGKMPTGNKLAGILKATRGIDAVVLDGSQITSPGGEVAFVENQIIEGQKKGNPIPEGAYVINSKILIIDGQGKVTKYY
mgnify:CR=1 FL=1